MAKETLDEVKEEVDKDVKGKKSQSVEKKEENDKFVILSIDNSPTEVVQYDQEGYDIQFDHTKFLELTDTVLRKLSYKNKKNYFVSKGMRDQLKKEVEPKDADNLMIEDPFDVGGSNDLIRALRERKKQRPGWVPKWKRTDEVDHAKRIGYKEVREPKKGKEEKPGHESGECKKHVSRDGKEELRMMEIREDIHEQHRQAVGLKSRRRYVQNKEDFASAVSKANRSIDKSLFKVVDDEGDVDGES